MDTEPTPEQLVAAIDAAEAFAATTRGAVRHLAIPLGDIATTAQYRRTFDADKLHELAASIRRVGVQAEVVVRPNPTAPEPRFELVVGERRLRASLLDDAALDAIGPKPTTIPAVVRDLTDAQVREIRLIENLHREDPSALEEAEAYEEMIRLDGLSVEDIAAKIDMSPAHVRARLKLLTLSAAPRAALAAGKLSESVALAIAARVPVIHHEQATRECLGQASPHDYVAVRAAEIDEPTAVGRPALNVTQPLSTRQAIAHLTAKYLLRLDQARFDVDDETLVPTAGCCGACPHRSGNLPELGGRPDLCTYHACFASKNAAAWERVAAAAMRDGLLVLADDVAARLFTGARVLADSPYVEPADDVPLELFERSGRRTWADLIKGGEASVPRAFARDATGAPRTLLDKAAAIAVSTRAGTLKDRPKLPAIAGSAGAARGEEPKPTKTRSQVKADREKAAREEALKRRARSVALGEVARAAAAEPKTAPKGLAWWRFVATALVPQLATAAIQVVVTRRDLGKADAAKAVEKYIADGKRVVADLRGLVVELLAAAGTEHARDNLKTAADLFEVDMQACKRTAALELADEDRIAAEAKAAEKKPAAKGKSKTGAPNLAAGKAKKS